MTSSSNQQPVFAETIETVIGETGEVVLVVFDMGESELIELHRDDVTLASEEFSQVAASTAIQLLMNMKRLRVGEDGTVPELARFMNRRVRGDASLLKRLADDFGLPMDIMLVKVWWDQWPSADELRMTLNDLSISSRRYLIDKAHSAAKRGEIKDPALVQLVESFRQKAQPQLEPREDEPPKKKKRSLRHPRRK